MTQNVALLLSPLRQCIKYDKICTSDIHICTYKCRFSQDIPSVSMVRTKAKVLVFRLLADCGFAVHSDSEATNMVQMMCVFFFIVVQHKVFASREEQTAHEKAHRVSPSLRCTVCRKSFSDAATLKRHLRVHVSERHYSCAVCFKGFADSGSLNKHRARGCYAHSAAILDSSKLPCADCGKVGLLRLCLACLVAVCVFCVSLFCLFPCYLILQHSCVQR